LYTNVMIVTAAALGTAIAGGGLVVGIATFIDGRRRGIAKGRLDEKAAADAAREKELASRAKPTTDQPKRLADGVFSFRVTNVGQVAAVHLSPALVDEEGKVRSEPLDPMLLKKDDSITFTIRLLGPSPSPLYLDYTWRDDSSDTNQRRHRSTVAVPTNG
jgi:hypothetical protein